MLKHILYIGLNDKDTKQQEINTIDAYKIIYNSLRAAGYDAATITEARGVYTHKNGAVTIELSLEVSILFAEDAKTAALVELVKKALNQEAIALQVVDVDSRLV